MATAETVEIEGIVIDNNDDNSNYRITLTREDGKMVTILVPKGAVNGGDDIWNDDADNIGLKQKVENERITAEEERINQEKIKAAEKASRERAEQARLKREQEKAEAERLETLKSNLAALAKDLEPYCKKGKAELLATAIDDGEISGAISHFDMS